MDKIKGIRTMVIGIVYFICVVVIVKTVIEKLPLQTSDVMAIIKDFLSFMQVSLIILLGGKIWAENKKSVGGK